MHWASLPTRVITESHARFARHRHAWRKPMPPTDQIINAIAAYLAGNHALYMAEEHDITDAVIADGRIVVTLRPFSDKRPALRVVLDVAEVMTVEARPSR